MVDSEREKRPGRRREHQEPKVFFDDLFFRELILGLFSASRWTQDTPIVPDLWLAYMRGADAIARARIADTLTEEERARLSRVSLLITPWDDASAGAIAAAIRRRLEFSKRLAPHLRAARIATTTNRVVADLDLHALVRAVVPLTDWWRSFTERFVPAARERDRETETAERFETRPDTAESGEEPLPADLDISRDARMEVEIDETHTLAAARESDVFILTEKASRGNGTIDTRLTIADMYARLTKTPEDGITAVIGEFLRFVVLVGFVERLSACATVRDYDAIRRAAMTLLGPPPAMGDVRARVRRRRAFRDFRDAYAAAVASRTPVARLGLRRERCIWMVNPNRRAQSTVIDSRRTAKMDAAELLFEVTGKGIAFAVVDTGIDARHRGFRRDRPRDPPLASDVRIDDPALKEELLRRSRVVRTYDFTQLRDLTADLASEGGKSQDSFRSAISGWGKQAYGAFLARLTLRANSARNIDWELLEPAIRVDVRSWREPTSPHGTHVAGILGADLPSCDVFTRPLRGMCPDIELWDLRVFDPETGLADEYSVTAALDFVRWINRGRDRPVIHGVNLSLALHHEVSSFACGKTPICETCDRLVAEGVVVVASAGNVGWDEGQQGAGLGRGYVTVSITDPGNAASVITVGSTHRLDPHAYGVSYFSSRGPTGDGRRKPDLLAPGEKIWSLMPGGRIDRLDGTSMAAPHVAGAAALLMARYPELIGRPGEIKRILMATATDLGREPYFQGAGLVDALRALQAV